jgi:hypothetical protein
VARRDPAGEMASAPLAHKLHYGIFVFTIAAKAGTNQAKFRSFGNELVVLEATEKSQFRQIGSLASFAGNERSQHRLYCQLRRFNPNW